ncbi:MAG: phage terminase large subunit [Desulfovibrionaceae bacterium]
MLDLRERGIGAGGEAELVTAPPMPYHDFVRQAWPIIEPGRTMVDGWHIGAICEHMEAVSRFEIKRLLITMPPRCMKSICVSALFTPWVWTWAPIYRFFYASYDAKLSRRDNQKARDVITSPWYQGRWGERVVLKTDQNEKDKFENTVNGNRFATSVAGRTTGEGGDFVICDDPHNVKDASKRRDGRSGQERDAKRKAVLEWWDNAIPSRLNDPKRGGFVIVQQRVHQQDLAGHVLEKGGYVHLCLPMEYEGRKYWTPIGFEDPRTEIGELLWPERYGPNEVADIKESMTEAEYAGQYQQRPAPAGGAIFKAEWFRTWVELPRFERRIWFWDTAQKTGDENDPSVGELWGEAHNGFYLLDVFRARLAYPDLKAAIKRLHELAGTDEVVVEDKSSGISVIQDLQADTTMPMVAYRLPEGDKTARAKAQAATVKGGNVWLPETAEWKECFMEEVTMFPASAYKDQVDVMDMALDYFQRGASLTQGRDMS